MSSKKFLDLIKKQRSKKKAKKFQGNFLDYLEMIQTNPGIAKSAHKRLFEAIVGKGLSNLSDDDPRKRKIFNGDEIRIYDYFSSISDNF